MRRADRLFQIIQILRRRRVTTAAALAEELEVSLRTIYRDIRDLMVSGVPIEGEAGVGYALPKGFDLPPLMFTREEIEALVLGARIVQSQGDAALRRAAEDVLAKVETVLPDDLKQRMKNIPLFVLNFARRDDIADRLGQLRKAVENRDKVAFTYTRKDGEETVRTVCPLSLAYVAPHWLLTGWCELREDFRSFRLDRIEDLALRGETFEDMPGRTLKDFLKQVTEERG